ncbi:hypothetical protein NRF20_39485 [Streptomyces sp. R-74717]|uniref:hypothetical protein n=1 Tax=Streptomyces TaxID=1883 RepID=UPI00379A8F85
MTRTLPDETKASSSNVPAGGAEDCRHMADRVDPANPQPSSSRNVVRSASCRRTIPLRLSAGAPVSSRQRKWTGSGTW